VDNRAEGMAQEAKHLLRKHDALSSKPQSCKKKKKEVTYRVKKN
jgi:hypothetical protein